MSAAKAIYGLVAEFQQPEQVLAAARQCHAAGYRRLDAYTPFPVDGLAEAIGRQGTRIPLIVLLAGIAGGAGGYFMQWYATVVDYPLNIGGRPFHSWPAYIPITFELTILCAAVCGVVGMLALNRLPQLYHPIFNAPDFNRASQDRFFLCIKATDSKFDPDATRAFLTSLGPGKSFGGGGVNFLGFQLKVKRIVACVAFCFLALAMGCRREMYNQPRNNPLSGSDFFADGAAARPLVPGTIARGHLDEDEAFYHGKIGTNLVKNIPVPITLALLERGQERYDIYCAVCHGRTGEGNGMIAQRGFPAPPSYHIDRLRQVPDGYFFDIITRGYGVMYSYASRIEPADRWAIAAYIRALQLSHDARLEDVPPAEQARLQTANP